MTNHYSQKDNLISIMKEISKKTPRGIVNGDTTVGHITWQMYLMRDYLKLDGTPLANASNDYSDLLFFAQDNNLITSDTTDNSLFKYDSTTDVLTLPDYIDLVLQGGNNVEEKEAGLPNIKGHFHAFRTADSGDRGSTGITYNENDNTGALKGSWINSTEQNISLMTRSNGAIISGIDFDASQSNSIYADTNTTVQPPAITLIPQIKYRKATTMYEQIDAVVNYSTTEKVIGTWIDGKPLYQITVEFITPSNSGEQLYSFLPSVPFSTMKKIINMEGNVARSDGWYCALGSTTNGIYLYRFDWNKTLEQLYIAVYSSGNWSTSNQPAILTLQYTKTTD